MKSENCSAQKKAGVFAPAFLLLIGIASQFKGLFAPRNILPEDCAAVGDFHTLQASSKSSHGDGLIDGGLRADLIEQSGQFFHDGL